MPGNVDWLSTNDAAAALGITPRTLYRFINDGQIHAYKFGRVIRLKRQDIEAFIEQSRIAPGTLSHLVPEPDRDDD